MNILHALSDGAEPLAWTLAHALWQGVVVALLVWGLLGVLPARRAALRHAVASAGVFACLGAAIATHATLLSIEAGTPGAAGITDAAGIVSVEADLAAPAGDVGTSLSAADRPGLDAPTPAVRGDRAEGAPARSSPWWEALWLPLICVAWALGVLVSLVRTVGGLRTASRMARATKPAPVWLQNRADRLAERLQVPRKVVVRLADRHVQPCVVGLLHPMILLPESLVEGSPGALRVVLAHELAHARGFHPLLALALAGAESLLFFHPGVRWLARQAALEREALCDAAAVGALGGDGAAVAETLGAVATAGHGRLPVSAPALLGREPGGVAERMRRLLSPSEAPGLASPRWLIPLAGLALLAAFALHRVSGLVAEELLSGEAFVAKAAEVAEAATPIYGDDAEPVSLSGTVTAEGGLPVGARVLIGIDVTQSGGASEYAVAEFRVGDDGVARFEHSALQETPPGLVSVSADAEGFARTLLPVFETTPGQSVTGIELPLTPGFSAELDVVDADGAPVAGAEPKAFFVISSSRATGIGGLGATDANGRLVFAHASSHEHWLDWEVPAFARKRTTWVPSPDETGRVVLERAAPTGGRVVDPAGRPVSGARVHVTSGFGSSFSRDPRRRSGNSAEPDAVTDADGVFRIDHAVAGSTGSVWVEAEGHAAVVRFDLAAGRTDHTLAMEPAFEAVVEWTGPIEELSRDKQGRPGFRWSQSMYTAPRSSHSGQGHFVPVEVLVSGVADPAKATAVGRIASVELQRAPINVTVAGETHRFERPWEIALRLAAPLQEPATRTVRLRLVPPAGWPVPSSGTMVAYARSHGRGFTNPRPKSIVDGAVSLDVPVGLDEPDADGGGLLFFRDLVSPGYRLNEQAAVVVPPGEGTHEIEVLLLPAGAVSGRVVTDNDALPRPEVVLRLETLEVPTDSQGRAQRVDGFPFGLRPSLDGAFSMGGLPLGGRYRVRARVEGSEAEAFSEPFTLTQGAPFAEREIRLEAR